jgi:hypothetical protein
MRQLADQLHPVFIAGLILLYVTTLKLVPVGRGPWLPWLVASVLLFLWVVYNRNKVPWPKLRWVFPFAVVALLWLMYLLSGVSLPVVFIQGLAIFVLVWAVFLVVALLRVMICRRTEGKSDKVIRHFDRWGESVYWQIANFVLLSSILLGWTRLWNAGMRGWWIDALLYLGIIVFISCIFARPPFVKPQ